MASAYTPILDAKRRALDALVASLAELGGIPKASAEKVAGLYLRHKMVTLDGITGRFHVKHGAALDRETIRGAAAS